MKLVTKRSICFFMTVFMCFISALINYFVETKPIISTILVIIALILFVITLLLDKANGVVLKNKMLWGFSGIITIIMFFGIYVERYFEELHNITFLILVILFLFIFLLVAYVFNKYPDSNGYKYFLLIIFEVQFIICTFTVESPWMMYTPLPLLVCYLLFREIKALSIAGGIIAVFNCISVWNFINKIDIMSNFNYRRASYFVQILYFLLFTAAVGITLKINNIFAKEKLAEVEKFNEKSDYLSKEIVDIAKKVKDNALNTNNVIEELEIATNNSLNVLDDIVQGNKSNAGCVENQTEMTANITDMIDGIINESDFAVGAAKDSLEGLSRSKESFVALKEKSNLIVEKNEQVISIINKFVENAKKVKNITNGIAEISEQTNLLSLNASIESARANTSAKDFGVVAGEIRGLADNTSTLTDNIDKIVQMLEHNAMKAQRVVNNVVESVNEENKTIDETLNDIIIIEENIDKLGKNVHTILDKIMNMSKFNGEIVNNILQLSASNQQVSAYTEEALRLNNENITKANSTKKLMDELLAVATKVDEFI